MFYLRHLRNELVRRLRTLFVAPSQTLKQVLLSHDLGLVLEIIAAVSAFLLAALRALSSIGKRVRELGTLKALGRTQRIVVRQVAEKSLAQRLLGGIVGVVVCLGIGAFGSSLPVSSTTVGGNLLGLGAETARTATSSFSLSAPIGVTVLAIGFGLALHGGLVAGTAGVKPRVALAS